MTLTALGRARILTSGQYVRLNLMRSRDEVVAAIERSTMGRLDDLVESYLPDGRPEPLAGVANADGFRVCIPTRARAPWWLLTPVFRGRVVETGPDTCAVTGRLVARRSTLAGGAIWIVLVVWLLWPIGAVVGGFFVVDFVFNVVYALPRTSERVMRRVEYAMMG